jgi:hypothetical protein
MGVVMFGLIANVISDHALRHGAKVRIISSNGDAHNAEVIGLCKRGRTITKYIQWKRLENVRAAFIPEKYRGVTQNHLWWDDKDVATSVAEKLTEIWKDVRIFHPDGRLLRDGISAGEALKRHSSPSEYEFRDVSPLDMISDRHKAIREIEEREFRTRNQGGT